MSDEPRAKSRAWSLLWRHVGCPGQTWLKSAVGHPIYSHIRQACRTSGTNKRRRSFASVALDYSRIVFVLREKDLSETSRSSQQNGAVISATPPHVDIAVPTQDRPGTQEKDDTLS
ncbi:hypothetical protein KM043_010789 [Ampulex compressa]|nr:hypothetical protein KM043_010789 [Ampulex compressa]